MLVQSLPDTVTKLAQMGDATIYEPAGDQPPKRAPGVPHRAPPPPYSQAERT